MKPRYQHDCSRCQYLGTIHYPAPQYTEAKGDYTVMRWADLYYCGNCESDCGGTVIARFSSRGSNYASCPISIIHRSIAANKIDGWSTSGPALATAVLFAEVQKLIPATLTHS